MLWSRGAFAPSTRTRGSRISVGTCLDECSGSAYLACPARVLCNGKTLAFQASVLSFAELRLATNIFILFSFILHLVAGSCAM